MIGKTNKGLDIFDTRDVEYQRPRSVVPRFCLTSFCYLVFIEG